MITRAYFMAGYRYKINTSEKTGDSYSVYHHTSFFASPADAVRGYTAAIETKYPGETVMLKVVNRL